MRFKSNGCILKKVMFLHFLQLKLNITIVYSLSEWNSYVIHVCVIMLFTYLQLQNHSSAHDLFSKKLLAQFWCATQQSYPNLTVLPFHNLHLIISTYLCQQGWILGEVNERWSSSTLPFFQRCCRHILRVSHLVFVWYFFLGHKHKFLMTKTN